MKTDVDVFVTEVPGLHVTVVRGIHEITFERGLVRIWTYDEHRIGTTIERRVNADMLMTMDDLLSMFGQVADFLQACRASEVTGNNFKLVPEGVH